MRKLLGILTVLVISVLSISMVSALEEGNIDWKQIKINNHAVEDGDVIAVDEGETLRIEVGLLAGTGAEDIEIEAKISGYEYQDKENLYDFTHIDYVQAGTTKYFDLSIDLPKKLEKDTYWLRLRVLDKNSQSIEKVIQLAIEPQRHAIGIADVQFAPYGNNVEAGRSLIVDVLLENYGDRDEKDVIVTASIPALGVRNSDEVDLVRTDNHNVDYEDVEGLFLPIPATAQAGTYEVVISVKYDDLREEVTETYNIQVTSNARFQDTGKLVLAVGPQAQTVAGGQTATYAVALTNAGFSSKAYVLEAVAGAGLTTSVTDNLVVLEPGKNKVVYVQVTPTSAPVGEHVVSLAIKSADGNVLETVSLRAVVTSEAAAGTGVSLRSGLEVALIVLVVLLVIVGLIIGFSRLKKDEEEEQTYY